MSNMKLGDGHESQVNSHLTFWKMSLKGDLLKKNANFVTKAQQNENFTKQCKFY